MCSSASLVWPADSILPFWWTVASLVECCLLLGGGVLDPCHFQPVPFPIAPSCRLWLISDSDGNRNREESFRGQGLQRLPFIFLDTIPDTLIPAIKARLMASSGSRALTKTVSRKHRKGYVFFCRLSTEVVSTRV